MEPLIHSGITDCLPENHPKAHMSIWCKECAQLVHAWNNENMQPWAEMADGSAYCVRCFADKSQYWGL